METLSSSGVVYIDNDYINNDILYFTNNPYILDNSTKVGISGLKIGFTKKNLEDSYIHFDIKCSALDSHLDQKLCSVHFSVEKGCVYKEFYFTKVFFKSILYSQPVISFKTNNSDITIKHIILIFKKYGR